MKRVLILSAVCVLLAAAPAGAQPPPPMPMGEGDYFPLQKGTTWTYSAGRTTIIVKVAGEKTIKVPDAKDKKKITEHTWTNLETTVNGAVVASEYVTVRKDGVYRCEVSGQLVTPELCFLKLPPKKGDTWDVNSTVAGEKVTGKFEVGEAELPATYEKEKGKKVKTVTVKTKNMNVNGQPLSLTYYFAPGVGIVKQEATVAGVTVNLELTAFAVANPTP